ncbi:3'-5'-exodeoxyribonuclease [Saccharomycopsis crataegensis]|uniref:3'-5'-exodeoxyribonuclease n=1 Tax=Saccharomycopsis crataegensis TaxID=43959 RepID=A0AAV5QMJ0_9ASCO|nr:3'-5'-exodeoxyribonuclease [Saccharomycopsis crataegensis]
MASTLKASAMKRFVPRYFDIGVNFTDPMFHGHYNGKPHHDSDLSLVLERARLFNVEKILATGSTLEESRRTMEMCRNHQGFLYSTVGVHPCSVTEFIDNPESHLQQLRELALEGKQLGIVKAFGEIGLDYDRLHYASADLQREYFKKQLDIAVDCDLPLFLHMRAACDDFIKIIEPYLASSSSSSSTSNGKLTRKHHVVHSFTGTLPELKRLVELGFYISVNGCSLKTEENLQVAAEIPLERLMIETDAPWCEIRKSHAGYKYLTGYPNAYYPEIAIEEDQASSEQTAQQKPTSKKKAVVQLHDHLPFPNIKKEKMATFEIQPEAQIGIRAPPLIKSRNEPVFVGLVAEVMAKLKQVEPEVLIDIAYKNSVEVFDVYPDRK